MNETSSEPQIDLALRVNGQHRQLTVPPRRLLSDALRHDLELTGTHVGCEHGVCGCCTVLLDGKPVRSCLMFAVSATGHEVTTVEGLSPDEGGLHPVQQAFQDCHGLQCGFCTPGFVTTISALLADNPDPTDEEVVEGISGNLCRCTGYQNIVKAVHRAAELMREGQAATTGSRGPDGADDQPPPDDATRRGGDADDPDAPAGGPFAPSGQDIPGTISDDGGDA